MAVTTERTRAGEALARPDETRLRGNVFPGPTVSGVCMIVAPVVATVGAALGIGIYHAAGADFVRGMAAHPTRYAFAINIAVASMVLLLVAVLGVAGAISTVRPRIGRAAGVVTVIGLAGPIFFQGVYWGGWHLTTPARQAAAAHMIDSSQVIPRTIMNISGPALVVGFLLLAIGAARSGVLSRPAAAALAVTCLIPAGFISGHLEIAAVAFACTSVALVPLGVRTLRGR